MTTRRIVFGIFLCAFIIGGCAGKTPPQIASTVATSGTTLMQGVRAVQQAVIDGEAAGAITRNDARASMEVFQRIGASGERVATLLNLLVTLSPDTAQTRGTIDQIQVALDLINSDLFKALLPIKNDAVRSQVSALAIKVSETITIINREILKAGVK